MSRLTLIAPPLVRPPQAPPVRGGDARSGEGDEGGRGGGGGGLSAPPPRRPDLDVRAQHTPGGRGRHAWAVAAWVWQGRCDVPQPPLEHVAPACHREERVCAPKVSGVADRWLHMCHGEPA